MPLPRAGGKRHYVKRIYSDIYEIGWCYESKYGGSRLLHHRWIRRDTNLEGAKRFAKKWGCNIAL
jgi:hypothetical protein